MSGACARGAPANPAAPSSSATPMATPAVRPDPPSAAAGAALCLVVKGGTRGRTGRRYTRDPASCPCDEVLAGIS
jgi:hypothetical protein